MIGVLAPVFGLALLDSLNPSAVAITLYLLLSGKPFVSRVISYAAGIFSANLVLGAALMLGLGSVAGLFDGPVAYGAQGAVGAALLGYAVLAPNKPKKQNNERRPRSLGLGAVFLLGVTVTLAEFSTALPYLGALAILTNAGLTASQWLPVLVAYNLVFVSPPLLLMGAYRAFGARLRPALERWKERLQGASREALIWVLGIAGFLLLADSVRYFGGL
jgi:cytochrome c biogenesis protein CcdA